MHPTPHRRRFLALAGVGLALPALARGAQPLETIEGRAFAARWSLTLPAGAGAGALRAPLQALLDGIDRALSPWRADSEITRFNQAAAGAREVSAETALVARAALEMAAATQGRFDPTVGPLVARWGFGPIRQSAEAVSRWQRIEAGPRGLVKAEPGLTLDPCGIAKGRALDRMAGIVAAAGHRAFLLDLGGELLARGSHPEGRPWQVAIEDPRPGTSPPAAGLRLADMAVATSGRRAQSYALGGQTLSHIIDPRGLRPVAGHMGSVSVLADTAMAADAWATALFAAGAEGPALARQAGVAALFLREDGAGLARIATGSFGEVLL